MCTYIYVQEYIYIYIYIVYIYIHTRVDITALSSHPSRRVSGLGLSFMEIHDEKQHPHPELPKAFHYGTP